MFKIAVHVDYKASNMVTARITRLLIKLVPSIVTYVKLGKAKV